MNQNNNKKSKKKLDQLDNYYLSILDKANLLINKKQYQQALLIVEDELTSPYIPKEYEEKLNDLSYFLNAEIKYLSKNTDYLKLNRIDLFNVIFEKNNLINTIATELFFARFGGQLEITELKHFELFFINNKSKDNDKQFLFNCLKNAKIDYEFAFFNKLKNKLINFNPKHTDGYVNNKYFLELNKLISKFTIQEPSLASFCDSILYMIYLYHFPLTPTFNTNELAFGILQYMLKALQSNESEIKNQEIYDHIINVINKMEE